MEVRRLKWNHVFLTSLVNFLLTDTLTSTSISWLLQTQRKTSSSSIWSEVRNWTKQPWQLHNRKYFPDYYKTKIDNNCDCLYVSLINNTDSDGAKGSGAPKHKEIFIENPSKSYLSYTLPRASVKPIYNKMKAEKHTRWERGVETVVSEQLTFFPSFITVVHDWLSV